MFYTRWRLIPQPETPKSLIPKPHTLNPKPKAQNPCVFIKRFTHMFTDQGRDGAEDVSIPRGVAAVGVFR